LNLGVAEWDRYTDIKPAWKKLGMNLRLAFTFLGVRSSPLLDHADISTKPASWTGSPEQKSAELNLVKPAEFSKGFRRLEARGAFLARAQFGPRELVIFTKDTRRFDCRWANFLGADMTQVLLRSCDFRGSIFAGAIFARGMPSPSADRT
jgi:hypothetical protein